MTTSPMVRACCFALILLTYPVTTLPAQSYSATNASSKDAAPMLAWEKTWDDGSEALGVASSKRGDICVAGYHTGQVKGRVDAFLVKFWSDGSPAWQKMWRWNDFADAWGVAIAQDGGIYVAGTSPLPDDGSAATLVKFSADGKLVWQRAWESFYLTQAHGVAVGDDGSVYVTGVTGDAYGEAIEAFLLKFSPDGELMWQRTWASEDGGIGNGGARSVAVASDGSIQVTGGSAFLAKFVPDGGLVWHRRWRVGDWNDAQSVAVSSDGSIYTVGVADRKVLLLKFLANGTLDWLREWTSGNNDIAYGVAVSKYDEIYVAGGTGAISIPLLLKFFADGTLAWQNAVQGYNSRAWAVMSGENSVYFVGGVLSEGSIGQLQPLSGKVDQPANVSLSSSFDILNTPSGSAGSPFGTLNMTNNSPIFGRQGAFLLKISEQLSVIRAQPAWLGANLSYLIGLVVILVIGVGVLTRKLRSHD